MTNGLQDIIKMRENISSLFDNFIGNRYQGSDSPEESGSSWLPDVDIKETKNEFVLYMSLPGVKKEDVATEIKDDMLTVYGKREVKENNEETWFRKEIPSGQFHRAFRISARIKPEAVKASFKDGILEINIPKADEAKPNKIMIE